ncbi:hypothetical protein DRO66_00295 [Candidatus Bathyarchaeota archaeon]|nr:MAG: hypothetical protein DRO66_00295 [Candidatus Bathyarchaeota archaeon]
MTAIADKANRLDSVPAEFYEQLRDFEPELLRKINSELTKLDVKDDRIKPTSKNLNIVNSILLQIRSFMSKSEYIDIVKAFGREFDTQAKLTKTLFEEEIGEFKSSPATLSGLESSKELTLLLLVGDSLNKPLFSQIKTLLDNSVSQNGLTVDLFGSMEVLITGSGERLGALSNYTTVNNNIRDQFSTSDREFTQQSANLQNIQWYLYAGGSVADTRAFCAARNGKYFHKTEVELWVTSQQRGLGNPAPSTKWQGQRPLTTSSTIFTLCGGYNCNHSLMPVSIFKVPKDVIQRNINNGNFTPTSAEIEQLGLAA